MKVSELIALVQMMPQDAEVTRGEFSDYFGVEARTIERVISAQEADETIFKWNLPEDAIVLY